MLATFHGTAFHVGINLFSLYFLVVPIVMLRSGIFGRPTAYAGILGFTLLLVFTVWTTLVPSALNGAMSLAVPGGLLVLAWNGLVARGLFRLSRLSRKE